jgi:hypothetical protein
MEEAKTLEVKACTKRTLEARLERAVEKANMILKSKYRLEIELEYLLYAILGRMKIDPKLYEAISNLSEELKKKLDEAAENVVVNEAKLDREVEKYEKLYGVKFHVEDGKILGVALVREKNKVRPVAVSISRDKVRFIEGKTHE